MAQRKRIYQTVIHIVLLLTRQNIEYRLQTDTTLSKKQLTEFPSYRDK